MQDTADAVIIGAGVVGSSIAYELARSGRKVTSIERLPDVGAGSTGASSAGIRFHYSTWEGVCTSWESKFGWEEWGEYLGASPDEVLARFHRVGALVLDHDGTKRPTVLKLFDRAGVPYEEWGADEIVRRIPELDPGAFGPPARHSDDRFWKDPHGRLDGYFTPDAGFVDDPQLATRNLISAARRHGADIRTREEVVKIRQSGNRVCGVDLASGASIDAPVVINAAGPHSYRVNHLAGVLGDFTLSTRPLRQEVHTARAPGGFSQLTNPRPSVTDADLGIYFRSHPGGSLLVGGTEPDCDPLEWVVDPDEWNPLATNEVFTAQILRVARRLPELQVGTRPQGVAGLYDVSDDWIPIYDRTSLDGYYVAIGTSGNQFKNAPVIGWLITSLISACENGRNTDAEPLILIAPRTGNSINLAHYSRRRKVNNDSSLTSRG